MKLRLFSIYLLLFALVGNSFSQELMVGVAKRNITPDPLLPVSGGVGIPRPSHTQQGDLYVRVAVFKQGEEIFALAVVDNLGWPSTLGNKSRALIKSIPPQNILIAATHTHSAPDAYAFPDEEGNHAADLDYLEKCVQLIAEAVNEARENLQPAHLRVAMGKAEGKIAYNYYAPILYDPNCGVIQAVSASGPEKGKTLFTLVNYAIHPEVIGAGRGILSPDLCGPLYDRIEEKTGGMALFVNGALGGMITADNRREEGKEVNTWEECQRIGNLLADEAMRIVQDAPLLEENQMSVHAKMIQLPVDSDLMKFILTHSPLNHQMEDSGHLLAQLNLINLGPAQMITIPGEALPNIGYYLKRNMPTDYPFLLGLCNDAFGYLLSKVDFDSFERYEYISRTSLGEMTGEIFMEAILELVENSPTPAW